MRHIWIALTVAGLAFCLAFPVHASTVSRLDPALGGGGYVFNALTPASPGPRNSQIAEDPHGRLLVLTSSTDRLVVARYLPGGQLDSSFGTAGLAYITLSTGAPKRENDEASAGALAIQPDGKILVGGSYDPDLLIEGGSGSAELVLARVQPNGSVDRSFGGNAELEMPPGGVIEHRGKNVLAIALQAEDILVGGEAGSGPAYVARYNSDGRLDRSFGRGSGMAQFTHGRAHGAVTGLLSPPGGELYVAGYLGANFLLGRLGKNGIPDRSFGKAGRVLTDAANRRGCGCSVGGGLARDRRGRLLVSGTILERRPPGLALDPENLPGGRAIAVARYTPSGALDRSFGQRGVARTTTGGLAHGWGIAVQRSGGIVVAGSSAKGESSRPRFTVVSYRPNGVLDRRFFGDGIFARPLGNTLASRAWDPIVDRSGRILVAGGGMFGDSVPTSAQGILLARFLPGG